MATGWAREGAVQAQIDSTVADGVDRARRCLTPTGRSLAYCAECGDEIPKARRAAIKGVRLCVSCQSEVDEQQAMSSGFNRRGSKDSQLR